MLSNQILGMHVYEGTSKQKKVNEFVNIDGSSGLVALKPVGKMHFAPSHTLLFSCSIVRDIWSVANQRANWRLNRAARATKQCVLFEIWRFLCQILVEQQGFVLCGGPRETRSSITHCRGILYCAI